MSNSFQQTKSLIDLSGNVFNMVAPSLVYGYTKAFKNIGVGKLSGKLSVVSTPRYNTVTYGKHSLRYVGPKLWGKLSTADRSAKTLQAFTNCIPKRDITRLMDTGCKGCILCCT